MNNTKIVVEEDDSNIDSVLKKVQVGNYTMLKFKYAQPIVI